MASISTGGGHGGKKAVDHEIPLIPFIDLLLCCIMFLLVTAVWNQLASVQAHLDGPGVPSPHSIDTPPPPLPIAVLVRADGYLLSSDAGDEVQIPLASEGTYDIGALTEHLTTRRRLDPNRTEAIVSADDGVQYAEVVQTMDVLAGSGFPHVTVSGNL
jgi:biopolymer transport protein ExbD